MTVGEAFEKDGKNLEITKTEEAQASRRHRGIRTVISDNFDIDDTFLTGSYARHTKTKPLKDVDIFCVLSPSRQQLNLYRKTSPSIVLGAFCEKLRAGYKDYDITIGRRAVTIDFGKGEDVMSFDVVPAFPRSGGGYEIPDRELDCWISTDPKIHAEEATAKNQAFNNRWKPLVKMIKGWNRHAGNPIRPSFLIEVVGLEIVRGNFVGYPTEIRGFLGTAAKRIVEDWPDPAGLGPDVNDAVSFSERSAAARALEDACRAAGYAQRLEHEDRSAGAIAAWRDLLGPLFPAG